MSRKIVSVLIVVSVALVGVIVPGCAGDGDEEIEIGGIFCMTGGLADMGVLIDKGAQLAVEEINAAGGVLGKDLVLLTEDSATTPTGAFDAYKKLVEVNGVEAIVGPMISGAVMASGNYASVMQVPMVSPSATSPLIVTENWTDWALRTCTPDNFQGQVLADIAIDAGYNTTAFLVVNNAYGVGLELVITDILVGAGKTVVASIQYEEQALTFDTELDQILLADSDVIFQVGYHTDSAKIYAAAASMALNTTPWLVAEGVYGLLSSSYPEAAEFMADAPLLGCTLIPEPGTPAFVTFNASYVARWGEAPSVYCDTAYDAVKLIALAIEDAGSYNGALIKDSLYDVGDGYVGASGNITWDANGDRLGATYGIWDYVETAPEVYEYVILDYVVF